MDGDMGSVVMAMPLLPSWLRLVWTVVFAGAAAVHVWHAWSMSGQPRWWHVGHTLMAAGMALMYVLDPMSHPGLYSAGAGLFGVLTVAVATIALVLRGREATLSPLWLALAVDMLVMTYMLVPEAAQLPVVSYVFVAYLLCQAAAWACGLWGRVRVRQPAAAGPVGVNDSAVGLSACGTPDIRISLTAVALGMAYMLVAR